jgi:hypothetical protein
MTKWSAVLALFLVACGGGGGPGAPSDGGPGGDDDALVTYGAPYEGGQFHLGPVDYEESAWHNACAPPTKYAPAVRAAEGTLLAGVWGGLPDVAG